MKKLLSLILPMLLLGSSCFAAAAGPEKRP